MQCSKCNTINDPDSKFCKHCGQYLAMDTQNDKKPDDSIRVGELIYAAYTHKEAGHIDEAILACQGAITLNDRSASAHGLLASLYEARGDIDSAIEEYRKALQLEPSNASITKKIISLDDMQRNPVEPVRHGRFNIELVKPHLPLISAAASLIIVLLIGTLILKHNMKKNAANVPPAQSTSVQQPMNQYPQNPQNPQGVDSYQGVPQAQQPMQGYAAAQGQPQQASQSQAPAQNNVRTMQQQPNSYPSPNARYSSGTRRSAPSVRYPTPVQSGSVLPSGIAPVITPINGSGTANNSGGSPVIVPVDANSAQPHNGGQQNASEPSITYKTSGSNSSSEKSTSSPIQPIMDPEERAMRLHGSGRYDEAIQAYRDVLKSSSDKGRVYQQMALSYQRAGKTKEAAESYRKAIDAYRSDLSAGRDASEVQRDIRACEAGLKTLGK